MSTLATVAYRVARRYKRRVWWADEDDLRQEAALACERARLSWSPKHNIPLEAFATVCAKRACGDMLIRASAPVSGPSRHGDAQLRELAGLHHAEFVDEFAGVSSAGEVDTRLDRKRLAATVRDRAVSLLVAAFGRDIAEVALAVLLDGETPRAVAARNGMQPALVYQTRTRAVGLLLRDAQCYDLWRQSEALLKEEP